MNPGEALDIAIGTLQGLGASTVSLEAHTIRDSPFASAAANTL